MTFVCFDQRLEETPYAMSSIARVIRVRHNTLNSVFGAFINLAGSLPYNISKYQSKAMMSQLRLLATEDRFDIVHIDHLHMAEYGVMLRKEFDLPIVLREHNIESTIVERYRDHTTNPLVRAYLTNQLGRISRYERSVTKDFDRCAVITKDDEHRLLTLQPLARTVVVPGGVEQRYFDGPDPVPVDPPTITFFGGFDWLPNRDALRWFIDSVMPEILEAIPAVVLQVIGKNVPDDLKLRGSKNIVFRGFVDDLQQAVQDSIAVIAPIRIGGGIRLKILESFAMRVPVISTTVGCEGIECSNGHDILIADDPGSFVKACQRLIGSPALRADIAGNAFRIAKEHYSWITIAKSLESIYSDCIGKVQYHG